MISVLLVFQAVDVVFFCCKQKTAYEMRISDWSSDVCSSDLLRATQLAMDARQSEHERDVLTGVEHRCHDVGEPVLVVRLDRRRQGDRVVVAIAVEDRHARGVIRDARIADAEREAVFAHERHAGRSEEHTSELQSLMRISYAVFCLKKKTK